MEDLRVLKHARHYISAMADGINPLTGEYAPPNDTISQERIQKCCAYVAETLTKLIDSGGASGTKKIPFSLTPRQIMSVQISENPIGINDFAKRINAVTSKNMRGISGAVITAWLADNGYLDVERVDSTNKHNRTRKVINSRSCELGITQETQFNLDGEAYEKLLYSSSAQKFILDNLDKIIKKG